MEFPEKNQVLHSYSKDENPTFRLFVRDKNWNPNVYTKVQEAAQTEIGLTGGGQDSNLLYLSGIPHTKVPSSGIIEKIVDLVEAKVKEKNN